MLAAPKPQIHRAATRIRGTASTTAASAGSSSGAPIGRKDQLPQARPPLGPHPARRQARSRDLVRARGIRPQPDQDRSPGQV